MEKSMKRKLIEGLPVLVVIDIQGGEPECNEPPVLLGDCGIAAGLRQSTSLPNRLGGDL
jgi:hypothetical protein